MNQTNDSPGTTPESSFSAQAFPGHARLEAAYSK
jgi:hypothetical protein